MTTSDETSGRLAQLEEQIQQLSGRLAALEQSTKPGHPAFSAPGPWPADPASAGAGWPDAGETVLSYSGGGRFGPYFLRIQQRAQLSDVLDADADVAAKVFAALASPARIVVLRALLDGPRTSQQLRAELDDASVGQLYHHLRELLAVGLVTQPARSQYAIPRGSQVALCIEIIAASHLAAGTPHPDILEEPPAAEGEPGRDSGVSLPPGLPMEVFRRSVPGLPRLVGVGL